MTVATPGLDASTAPASTIPLSRNREFNLLWGSQTLSNLGSTVASLALPLLVLAVTGSAVQAGLVGTCGQVTRMLCRLPAGVLADCLDRRRALLACDAIRLSAYVVLGIAVCSGWVSLPLIVMVAMIDAVCGTLFGTTESAALASIMPTAQLPAAAARNEARAYGTGFAGPPLGGLLYGVGHAMPFLFNAVSYLVSMLGVAMVRKPLQAEPASRTPAYTSAVTEGLRFVARNDFLRVVLIICAPFNFALTGAIFTIIVSLQRSGESSAVIGCTDTIVCVGGVLGALAATTLQRRIRPTTLARATCWATTAMLLISSMAASSILAAVPVTAAVFLGPACNAMLFGHQSAVTPDRLRGRVLSISYLAASSAAAAAPLVAGTTVATAGATTAILIFAAATGAAAVAATFSTGIRRLDLVVGTPCPNGTAGADGRPGADDTAGADSQAWPDDQAGADGKAWPRTEAKPCGQANTCGQAKPRGLRRPTGRARPVGSARPGGQAIRTKSPVQTVNPVHGTITLVTSPVRSSSTSR